MEKTLDRRWQYSAYTVLCLVVIGVTAALLPSSTAYFQRFIGNANPLRVAVLCSVVGAVCLGWLQYCCGFEILRGRATLRGLAISAGLATLLGIAIIIADVLLRYPEEINVPMPLAVPFYPAIGFVAEIVFHILPLALLLLVLTPLRRRFDAERIVWIAIFVVAISEPIFQVTFEGAPFSGLALYTLFHVFVIALLQLAIFRRYDFMSMYAFRLSYYAYWHIVWGMIRLEVLF